MGDRFPTPEQRLGKVFEKYNPTNAARELFKQYLREKYGTDEGNRLPTRINLDLEWRQFAAEASSKL